MFPIIWSFFISFKIDLHCIFIFNQKCHSFSRITGNVFGGRNLYSHEAPDSNRYPPDFTRVTPTQKYGNFVYLTLLLKLVYLTFGLITIYGGYTLFNVCES